MEFFFSGITVTDGTSIFIIDDIRDGYRVGNIILDHILRPGFIKANGAIVNTNSYPRLTKFVVDNNLNVSETEWQNNLCGKYVYSAADKTLRVPDLRALFIRALDDGRGTDDSGRILGSFQNDAMRNIIGEVGTNHSLGLFASGTGTGAIQTRGRGGGSVGGQSGWYSDGFTFDSSRIVPTAPEVRTKNVALIAQIKY